MIAGVNAGTRALRLFGWLFIVAWGLSLVAFPFVKGVPSGAIPVLAGAAIGAYVLRRLRASGDAVGRFFDSPSTRFLFVVIAVAAFVRIAAILYFPLEPQVDDAQFQRYAVNLLAGHGYGAPGFRAWFPPGMSLMLSAWYAVTVASPLSGKTLQVLIGCGLVWQTWAFAREAISDAAGRIAAVLVALLPTLVFYTATLGYEIMLGLVFVVACRVTLSIARGRARAIAMCLALGALIGWGALVQPICLLLPLIVAIAWGIAGVGVVRAATLTAVVVMAMATVVGPWTYRNFVVLHAFVPVSTNGGYTLYSANNPDATGLAMQVAPLPGESDEVARDHLRMSAALSWIRAHPLSWSRLAVIKIVYTWGTTSSIMSVVSTDRLPPTVETTCKFVLNLSWAALFVWCAAATRAPSTWTRPDLILATLLVAYTFGLHLFYEALSRYHVPVTPLLCVVGAAGLARCCLADHSFGERD